MNDRNRAVYAAADIADALLSLQAGQPVNAARWQRLREHSAHLGRFTRLHRWPVYHPRRWYAEVYRRVPMRWRMRWPLPVVLVLALAGCRAPGAAVRTLEGAGYSSVKVTGGAVGCCYDRPLGDSFEAVGPDGRAVRGCVCRYLWGSPIIRTK